MSTSSLKQRQKANRKLWLQAYVACGVALSALAGVFHSPAALAQTPDYHDVIVLSAPERISADTTAFNTSHHSHQRTSGDTKSAIHPRADGTAKSFVLKLSSMGYDFTLALTDNPAFDRTQIVRHSDGTTLDGPNDQALPDLWSGVETTDPQSWVRLTHDAGRLSGEIHAFGRSFAIEPAEQLRLKNTTANVMFDATRRSLSGAALGSAGDYLARAPALTRATQPRIVQRNTDGKVTRAIRVGVVVDSLFNEFHGQRGYARALTIMNTVDGIYQDQLGLAVVVDSVVLLDDPQADPMRDKGGAIEDMLIAFRDVRRSLTALRTDLTLVHLLTGLRDPNNVIGLGWINTACRLDGYDVSLSTPFAFDSLLAAHEMAHNLGALHDNDPSCESDRTTIMWPLLSGTTTTNFSNCSIEAIQPTINASCNLDVVDMAVSVSTSITSGVQNLVISVTNEDALNRADRVITETTLPAGIRLIRSNGLCALARDGITLTCNHGAVIASATDTVTLLVDVTNLDGNRTVTSRLSASSYADININNDRSSADFLDVLSSAAQIEPGANATGQTPLSDVLMPLPPKTGGSGTPWPGLLAMMGLMVWVRLVLRSGQSFNGITGNHR